MPSESTRTKSRPQHKAGWVPQGGSPKKTENKENTTKNKCFSFKNFVFGISRPRSIQPWWIFSIWSPEGDRQIQVHFSTFFRQNPHPYSGLCQLWGRLPCLPMDRSGPGAPDLCGRSCGRPLIWPKIPIFQFFRGSRQDPSSCLMLKSAIYVLYLPLVFPLCLSMISFILHSFPRNS